MPVDPTTRPRILFLAGSFPEVSETFVWREAVSLDRLGDVTFMSLSRRTGDDSLFPGEARTLAGRMDYRRGIASEALPALGELARTPGLVRQAWSLLPDAYAPRLRLGRLVALARVRRSVRRLGIGVVHAHWRGPTDVAYLNHRLFGTPYTMFLHAHDIYDEGLGDASYRPLFEDKVACAARVFTCTARNVETLQAAFPHARVELSYHGVDEDLFSATPDAPPPNGPLRLLSVGRLIHYKGFNDLVPLAVELRRRGVDFTWDVVGDGSLRGSIEAAVTEHGLVERVRVRGTLPNAGVVETMRASDVLVFLGLQQEGQYGLPNVLLEAAACGLCVISRPLDTLDELIVPGQTGYVDQSLDALAGRIERLQADRPAVRRIGDNARGFVASHHRHRHHVARAYGGIVAAATR